MAVDSAPLGGATYYAPMDTFDPEELKQPFASNFLHLKRSPPAGREEGTDATWQQRLASQHQWFLRSTATVCAMLLAASLLVGITVVAVKRHDAKQFSPIQTSFSSWCITPLGGGMVGAGGDFKHFNNTECDAQLVAYFAPGGAYVREVELVGGLAMTYFLAHLPANPSQLVVFDIDETVLSNIGNFFTRSGPLGRVVSTTKEQREAGRAAADAPALLPMLRLYNQLYLHNYSVAFVTGRGESFRQGTSENLLSAGFGSLCPAPMTGDDSSSLWGAVPPADASEGRSPSPCYSALILRAAGDVRYASVYKPEARAGLEDLGYEVVGNLGDQFSDLVGPAAATPGSFKMPNPQYYIL